LLQKTSFKGVSKNENEVIVWAPIFSWKYFIRDRILIDFAHINYLSRNNIKFKICVNKNIGVYHNKKIFIAYDFEENLFSFKDYTKQLYFIICQLEKQNNVVFPSSKEYLYWENKQYMHEMFDELNISQPNTRIVSSFSELEHNKLNFPFLVKEVHSCQSNGIFKIDNIQQLLNIKDKLNNDCFLIQELLNIRRDLRVTLVGEEIVHFYWRVNNTTEWRPTATSNGSTVDFINFPTQWKEFIISEFSKLNIITGAFDVAWQDDDLSTKPLILEVSPTYQLNPISNNPKHLQNYGNYKKYSILGTNNYLSEYITQTFNIVDKVMNIRLNQF
jgi:hypothetical protein